MVPVWKKAVKKVQEEIPREKLPMLGVGAAFSFLMMMFNVPLPGGTTGHAVGGTLLAILIGPYAACLSVTVALFIQAVLFGDGGILAFGANCFNMAFILPFTGYYIYSFIKSKLNSPSGESLGILIGSYIGINVAAFLTAVEFGIQPLLFKDALGQALYCPYPLSVSIPAMMIPHILMAGVVEAVFTLAIIAYIRRVSPGTLYEGKRERPNSIMALVVLLICLTPLGLIASGTAWGEWGSDEIHQVVSQGEPLGYTPHGMAEGFGFNAMMPDYTIGGLPEIIGYVLSAVAGASLLIIVFKLMGVKHA